MDLGHLPRYGSFMYWHWRRVEREVGLALGLEDNELIACFAVFAPAGTPADVIARLNQAVNVAAASKDIVAKFEAIGFTVEPGPPEALARRNAAETVKWEKAIRDAKIKAR